VNDVDPNKAIVKSETPNLWVLPADVNLVGAEIELVSRFRREYVMKGMIDKIREDYDYVFIDCLPSLGIITVNAITSANSVLIPVQCEFFALEGLGKLKKTISLIKQQLNPELEIEGILLSMYDSRLRLANIVVKEVKENIKDYVFNTIIHRNSRISEAPNMKLPVIMYDTTCKGSVNFLNLAKEFLQKNKDSLRGSKVKGKETEKVR